MKKDIDFQMCVSPSLSLSLSLSSLEEYILSYLQGTFSSKIIAPQSGSAVRGAALGLSTQVRSKYWFSLG